MNPPVYPEVAEILSELAVETGCADWQVAGRILPRRNSRVAFLESRTFRIPRIVLKTFVIRPDWDPATKFHGRSRRYYRGATESCTVPEPVALLTKGNSVATAFIDAPFAGQLLRHGFHPRKTREAIVEKAARWLRWFHDRSGLANKPLKPEFFKSRLGRLTGEIEVIKPGLVERDPFLARCLGMAGSLAEDIAGKVIPHGSAHGDFTPYNIFIRGETAVGIDFDCQPGFPVTYDICRFLLYMDLHRILPAAGDEIARTGCRKDDLDCFSSAYGMDAEWMNADLWLKLQFFEMVRRMTALKLKEAETGGSAGFVRNIRLRRNAGLVLKALG